MSQLIALGGYKCAGKDAVADYLIAARGWSKVGVSDAIMEHMVVLDPYVPVMDEPGQFERFTELHARVGFVQLKENPEGRRLLDVYGTNVARGYISDTIWAELMAQKVEQLLQYGSVAVTGVGFPAELEILKGLGARTVWVDRPDVRPVDDIRTLGQADFDETLLNDGSRTLLFERVEELVSS